jgi:hypothetical protein
MFVARCEPACPPPHLRAELPADADQVCKQEAGIFGDKIQA